MKIGVINELLGCISFKASMETEKNGNSANDGHALVKWNVEVLSVKFYGAVFDEKDIFPTPDTVTFGGKTVPAGAFDSFSSDSDAGREAGRILAEKFQEVTGVQMSESGGGKIKLVTDCGIAKQAFRVCVSNDGAEISAADKRGFVMGAETFIKLCEKDVVHTADIEDAPAYPFRGVHLFLPSEKGMDFAKRLVKYVISPMGYNGIIIEIAGGMKFDSHPEINEAVVKALCREKVSSMIFCLPLRCCGRIRTDANILSAMTE